MGKRNHGLSKCGRMWKKKWRKEESEKGALAVYVQQS